MPDLTVNPSVYLIPFIIGVDIIFGNEAVFLHVPESLVKAVVTDDGIDEGFYTKFLRFDIDHRIQLYGFNGVGIEPVDLLGCTTLNVKHHQRRPK
jgi:hypothetical protein